jgi:hypothetical protein
MMKRNESNRIESNRIESNLPSIHIRQSIDRDHHKARHSIT